MRSAMLFLGFVLVETSESKCADLPDPTLLNDLPPLLRNAASDAVMAIGTLDAELLFLLQVGRLVPETVFVLLGAEAAT